MSVFIDVKRIAAVGLGLWMLVGTVCIGSPPASSRRVEANEPTTGEVDKPGDEKDAKKDDGKDDEPKTVAELAQKCDRMDGLFTLLRDRKTGQLYLMVKKEQLGKEFIYFTYTENGVSRVGHFRGNFRDTEVFTIERDYRRLRFVFQPTRYHYDRDSALSRAADANVSRAVLSSQKIVAMDEAASQFVVSADDLLLGESFHQVKPSADPDKKGKSFGLGKLSKDKTRFASVRTYPKNTDLIVEYVYEDPAPAVRAERGEGVTDSRYISIKMQHSLIEMPVNDFQPRRDDPRVGFFMQQVDDMTSTSPTPYRDVINRWYLKKKDPAAALSEPVEPIVWWIENTTPVEFRDVIRDAVLAWNEAFEQAGFKNAVVVKVQPDDAQWDAGDLRYNVLRWTSSPDPRFGGYGPSFVNPRTGQILGADVMLEWVFVTNRIKYERLFHPTPPPAGMARYCDLGSQLHATALFGRTALLVAGAPKVDVEAMLKDSLYYLALHEVGHTLGLMHNMKSSQLHALKELQDRDLTQRTGLTGSVMDYPAINLAGAGQKQGQYYTTRPGPYDRWAIEYGYSPAADDPAAEEQRLQKILARSTEPALAFGNDADDMRSPGHGIDPRVMINDMSSDAIGWAEQRITLVRGLMGKLTATFPKPGESYQALRDAYFTLTYQQSAAATAVSRYIGGVYLDRAFVGQPGATQPFAPVAAADQQRAMRVLAQQVFAPDAFEVPADLLARLQQQRRGFNHFDENEDIQVHEHVLGIHKRLLDHLLHADVLRRITDARLYGDAYSLGQHMTDLTAAVFDADARGNVNAVRQNLQTEYVGRLIDIAAGKAGGGKSGYGYPSQSMAEFQLRRIRAQLDAPRPDKTDLETQAHLAHLRLLIDRALAVPAAEGGR